MKFVLGCIPIFDGGINFMKKKIDETPFIQNCNHSKYVPFKILITDYQYQFPLIHVEKNHMESSQ